MPSQAKAMPRRPAAPERPVQLTGDAYLAFTAPFYPVGDPLAPPAGDPDSLRRGVADSDALIQSDLPLASILQGTLTFEWPELDLAASFVGRDDWVAEVRRDLHQELGCPPGEPLFESVDIDGLLFKDGYGSISCTVRIAEGWNAKRVPTLDAVGPEGRDRLAGRMREKMLAAVTPVLRGWGADGTTPPKLPYFNLTYAGHTGHPAPGRGALDDGLRCLVYPHTSQPLPSTSPLLEEYLFTGYAYHLLASRDPVPTLRKLTLLLHVLNVSYARLAGVSGAADAAMHSHEENGDVYRLAAIERRLRSEYQALITPTFSFDHHALTLRDAILESWDVPKLEDRAENMIAMIRRAVEFRMADNDAKRIGRLNRIILLLAVLSLVSTAEAAVSLFDFFS